MKQIKSAHKYHRLDVFQIEGSGDEGQKRVVGSGSIREGDSIISLRLFTLVNERFFVVMSKDDPEKYLVMTREPNQNTKSTNKYFWHVIGHGRVYPGNRIVELKFDLFAKPIFLNLRPEDQSPLNPDAKEAS